MRAEERISHLESELALERAKNAQLQAELAAVQAEHASLQADYAQLRKPLEQMLSRLNEVEGQVAKDSHNSSKPPSSDGLRRKPRSQRPASGKPTGGQAGHAGRTLLQVASPDQVVQHRPAVCSHWKPELVGVPGRVKERRQVHDLPEVRLLVREQQVEEVRCPRCQHLSEGSFPSGVEAPAQYGSQVRALAVYLHQYQLVPLARTCELLADLYQCQIAEGTLTAWVEVAAQRLGPTVERIADWLRASRLQHGDETGVHVGGKLHWVHVNSTGFLTPLACHAKPGKQALEEIGIWSGFEGRGMHDRWKSYDRYGCQHRVCGAHLVRDCTDVGEQEQQEWATQRAQLRLEHERGRRAVAPAGGSSPAS